MARHAVGSRIGGYGLLGASLGGLLATVQLQRADLRQRRLCAGGPGSGWCIEPGSVGAASLRFSGLMTLMGGGLAAGVMFGRARAASDLLDGRRMPTRSKALAWTGALLLVGSAETIMLTYIVTNDDSKCGGDPACQRQLRRARFAIVDVASVGVALGAGIAGFLAAERGTWARARTLSIAPTASRSMAGVTLGGRF